MRNILITNALFYSNGALHLGHILEAVQADVWARFQRLNGNSCIHIGGEDAHGTPIMLSAKKAGISPESLIENMYREHREDLAAFAIAFDNYHTTHSSENRALCSDIYRRLQQNGDIQKKVIKQAFDQQEQIFLPDRFIRGTCPRCKTVDQYGDHCESCGATYSPTELIDPVSAISGTTPVERESEHYFFNLGNYQALLSHWIEDGHLQPQVANKLKEWFTAHLLPWDISRDEPYFGFEIPDAPQKYFYVWLDAPIGYIASFKNFCDKNPAYQVDDYWKSDSTTELYHFVGKDIAYFHGLFWPALLSGAGLRLPTQVIVHGFVTINGEKMSKSRGTFITAKKYLEYLEPEFLRYYFCCKLGGQVEDIDLNITDFMQRNNADLVGKFVNLASRCAGFIHKKFGGKLAAALDDTALFDQFVAQKAGIAAAFEALEYSKAIRTIMALADQANQYIDQQKPWQHIKEENSAAKVHAVCTQGLNLFKILATYLKPILPVTATNVETFLNTELSWKNLAIPLLDHPVNPFKPLMQRITEAQINALTDD